MVKRKPEDDGGRFKQRSIASFFARAAPKPKKEEGTSCPAKQPHSKAAAASDAAVAAERQAQAAAEPPSEPAAPVQQPAQHGQQQQQQQQQQQPKKPPPSFQLFALARPTTNGRSQAAAAAWPDTAARRSPATQPQGEDAATQALACDNRAASGSASPPVPPVKEPASTSPVPVATTVEHSGCAEPQPSTSSATVATASTAAAVATGEDVDMADAAAGGSSAGAGPADSGRGQQGELEVAPGEEPGDESGDDAAGDGETDYERQRMERIRRNMEIMRSMGLGGPVVSPKRSEKKKAAPRRKAPPAPAQHNLPLRRSGRRCGGGGGAGDAAAEGAEAQLARALEEEPPLVFDDSSVMRYVCEVGEGAGRQEEAPEAAQVTGFAQLAGVLVDTALARAYSVDWQPGLVVAAGKDGQVSIFGSREVEAGGTLSADAEVPPLLSARLHRGWIADVQFVRGGAAVAAAAGDAGGGEGATGSLLGSSLLLLTAGNDGTVCLWDAARSAAQGRGMQPQQLAKAEDLHSGGIFSMHEAAGTVLTASKDCTVAVSLLGQGGSGTISLVQRYEELHEGVVKCARWRCEDATVFASCGNDRSVCVVDTRQPGGAAALALPGAHSTAINCLRWHPTSEHLLLSTSHDPHILLHDLRRPDQPLFTFTGHSLQSRISAIYQPAFVWGGTAVATGGEKSGCLSLYCTATGSTLSRGEVGFNIGATCAGRGRQDPLICTATKEVHLLAPTWRPAAAAGAAAD